MQNSTFEETIKKLEEYSQRYETITLFELRQLFGSSLFALLIFVAAFPLLFFSTSWIVLPLTSFIILSAIWFFFDQKLWLPDFLNRLSFSSAKVQKAVHVIDEWLKKCTWQPIPLHFWQHMRSLNIVLIALAAFQIGFIHSPSSISFFSVVACLFLASATLFEQEWLSCLGYLFFLFAIL